MIETDTLPEFIETDTLPELIDLPAHVLAYALPDLNAEVWPCRESCSPR